MYDQRRVSMSLFQLSLNVSDVEAAVVNGDSDDDNQ